MTQIRVSDKLAFQLFEGSKTIALMKLDEQQLKPSEVRELVVELAKHIPITIEPIFKRTPDLAQRVTIGDNWEWSKDATELLERSMVERRYSESSPATSETTESEPEQIVVPPSHTGTAKGILPAAARANEAEVEIELVLVKCTNCFGHLGVDPTFLDQVRDYVKCPYCDVKIKLPEDEADVDQPA